MMKNVHTTWLGFPIAAFVCFLFTGCDQREMLRKMTPMEDYQLARTFVSQVAAGDIASAEKSLSSQINAEEARKGLASLSTIFNHGEIKSFEVVGLFFRAGLGQNHGGKFTEMTMQLELSTGWFVGTVVTTVEGEVRKIVTANFQSIPDSLEKINALNLMDRPVLGLLFIPLLIAVPLFSIYALVLCIRTPLKRKWLWILFILMGVTTLRLNWSTGGMGFQLVSVQLLGASFSRSGLVGPWIFGLSFPLGAVLFLRRRRSLMVQAAGEEGTAVNDVSKSGQEGQVSKLEDLDLT